MAKTKNKINIPTSPFVEDKYSDYSTTSHGYVSNIFKQNSKTKEFCRASFSKDTIWEEMINAENLGVVIYFSNDHIRHSEGIPHTMTTGSASISEMMTTFNLVPQNIDVIVAIHLIGFPTIADVDYILDNTNATLLYCSREHPKALLKICDIYIEDTLNTPLKDELKCGIQYDGNITEKIINGIEQSVLSIAGQECLMTLEALNYGSTIRDPNEEINVKNAVKAIELLSFGQIKIDQKELRPISRNQMMPALIVMYKRDIVSKKTKHTYELLMGLCRIWASACLNYSQKEGKITTISGKPNAKKISKLSEELGCVDELVNSLMLGVPVEDII